MRLFSLAAVLLLAAFAPDPGRTGEEPPSFFAYLTAKPAPTMITYTPSELDPRFEANQRKLATRSLRSDLEALRPSFDGLILYGYHEACTPRIVALARALKFRALLLAVWDPKSAAEVDGVADLVRQHRNHFALGVLLGNEGITFKRYEAEDLTIALARLRNRIPKGIPVSTSEPLAAYESAFVRSFGDFLAPNIHPVFDRPKLGPEEAASWVREQATRLARLEKKPLLVKETGFPHDGKKGYSPATQNAFWSAYVKPGLLNRLEDSPKLWTYHGVAFDAFDLPWKAEESKLAIEKSWGLFSNKRAAYPALAVWRDLAPK